MKLYNENQIHNAGLYGWAKQNLKRFRKTGTTNGGPSQAFYYAYSDEHKEILKNLKPTYIHNTELKAA